MTTEERRGLIEELQSIRGNTVVISYITSTRPGLETMMAMDAVRKIYRHLQLITTPKEETKIDLFIHSNGGDGIVPWRLVTLIREYCSEFSVLVPHRAFSAATLTSIGADNIFMHPMGMLGPTDPKVENEFNPKDPNNPAARLGINVEDVISYISLVKDEVGIRHEDELIKAFEFLAGENKVHPLALGNVKRFYSQSRMMARKLLELHMDKSTEEHKITEIADNLNSKLYFHGHPINRTEAKEQLGLKIKETTPELEAAMWELYEGYEKEMEIEDPFNPNLLFKQAHPNLQLTNLQTPTTTTHNIPDVKVAFIESAKRTDKLMIDFKVEGIKFIGQGIQEAMSVSQTRQEWVVEVPAAPAPTPTPAPASTSSVVPASAVTSASRRRGRPKKA